MTKSPKTIWPTKEWNSLEKAHDNKLEQSERSSLIALYWYNNYAYELKSMKQTNTFIFSKQRHRIFICDRLEAS